METTYTTRSDAVDVSITVCHSDTKNVWAYAMVCAPSDQLPNVSVATGTGTSLNDVILSALEEALRVSGRTPITVYSTSAEVRAAAAHLRAHLGTLTVSDSRHAIYHPLHDVAERHMHTTVDAAPAVAPAERIVQVYTDGSWSRYNHIAGIGVLFTDGRYKAKSFTRVKSPLAAELRAIAEAVKMAQPDEKLEVFTDSRNSLSVIAGRVSPPPGLGDVVATLRTAKQTGKATFHWVKGHNGDPLNEGADRLAMAARRNADFAADKHTASTMYEQIITDSLGLQVA